MHQPIKLYRHPLSGHSHRVELLLSLLDLRFERHDVDLLAGAQRQPGFLAKNPLGQVPVIEDGPITLSDSNAILVYLALRYDASGRFYPRDPLEAAQVQRWLSLAAGELRSGPGQLRLHALLNAPVDRPSAEAASAQLFALLEASLSDRAFLSGQLTIADIAMFSYTAHAPEGGLSLAAYPSLRRWLTRIEELPRFVPMQSAPRRAS
jgi:glutathione S-transferase